MMWRCEQKSLLSGFNVIDTASNFTDGESEKSIGNVLKGLVTSKEIARDEIVVIGKAGHIKGRDLEAAKSASDFFPEVLKASETYWYCISPSFLENQINRSLERLGLETIDIFLLPDPEDYFSCHLRPHHKPDSDSYLKFSAGGQIETECYTLIEQAFRYLETEVKRGRIQWYGVSSSTLSAPVSHFAELSLEHLLQVAQSVSPSNHFAAVEFPLNLFEHEAITFKNYANSTMSLLDIAQKNGLMSFTNRPFDAILNDQVMFRLVQPPHHLGMDLPHIIKNDFNSCIHTEKVYPGVDPDHYLSKNKNLPNCHELAWAQIIISNIKTLDYFKYKAFVSKQLKPVVEQHLKTLSEIDETKGWATSYRLILYTLLEHYEKVLEHNRHFEVEQFETGLEKRVPSVLGVGPLPHKALRATLAMGADCTLVGMREQKYVQDVIKVVKNQKILSLSDEEWKKIFEYTNQQKEVFCEKYKQPEE